MAQSLLAKKATVTPAVYRVTGTTAVAVGATFGSVESFAVSPPPRPVNHVLVANNGLTSTNKVQLVAWMKQNIYTFDEVNGWVSRFSLSGTLYNGTSTQVGHSGLYKILLAGVPTIVGFYLDGSNQWWMIKTTDQTWKNWSDAVVGGSSNGFPMTPHSEVMFKNTFYTCNPLHTGHFSYDINGAVLTARTESDIPTNDGQDFCPFGNALYKIAQSVASPGYWIWVLNAGVWTKVYQLPTPSNPGVVNANTAGITNNVTPVLFDGGDGYMYAIYQSIHDSTHWGTQCVQVTASGLSVSGSDISSTVLPASFAYGVQSHPGIRWHSHLETKTIPGNSTPIAATPTIHIFSMNDPSSVGGPWNYYLWNGPATLIGNGGLANSSGLDISYILPGNKDNGDDRIWYPADFMVDVVAVTGSGTGINIDIVAYGPLGTEIKSALAYFSVTGQTAKYVCKLIGVSKVSGSGATPTLGADGHSANNLTCDGATIYRLAWDALNEVSPGPIIDNEDVEVKARIF